MCLPFSTNYGVFTIFVLFLFICFYLFSGLSSVLLIWCSTFVVFFLQLFFFFKTMKHVREDSSNWHVLRVSLQSTCPWILWQPTCSEPMEMRHSFASLSNQAICALTENNTVWRSNFLFFFGSTSFSSICWLIALHRLVSASLLSVHTIYIKPLIMWNPTLAATKTSRTSDATSTIHFRERNIRFLRLFLSLPLILQYYISNRISK